MTSIKNFLITATFAVGMTAAGAGTAFAAAPTTAAPVQSVAFTQPSYDWNDNRDRDRDRDRDRGNWGWGNRGNWGWHVNGNWGNRGNWGVSPQQCRRGGGHVDWNDRKCRGGRYGGDRLRIW
ncbi:MAG TPA: hypothetical protein VIQ30_15715 [Pseudonocardia sp.]